MRLLLVSTYELGRQPIHLASPAAALGAAGIEVSTVDLAVEPWDPALLDRVDAVAFSVPMHTAMRLAGAMAGEIRALRPQLPIAFYGLYADVGLDHVAGDGLIASIAGEYEPGLVAWARQVEAGDRGAVVQRHVGRSDFHRPDRSGLPRHDKYARLEWLGEARLAAAVEASHGCRHRCRHCPIPVVYDGRMRVVGAKPVLADIDQLAADGIEHITFGDPDFLNAPRYSLDLLRATHADHPGVTFDVTVKVEHILAHRSMWPEMASLGLLFVVSAFESTDLRTLGILDKNHTVSDMAEAVTVLRSAGIHVRPTWLPFLPWTTPRDLVDIVAFIDHHELWSATDPVQLAIKLLIPRGSLLETHPAVTPHLSGYVPESLTWAWEFEHAEAKSLHADLDAIAAAGSDCDAEAGDTLTLMRDRIARSAGVVLPAIPESAPTPRLTESWFCCAEPTSAQAGAVGLSIGRVPVATE
ncbi:MAG TPA: radical SAM protein [Acidimicrobiia bacterium]|nr:radical SAM protein [Acidimicrobiia bacterium]